MRWFATPAQPKTRDEIYLGYLQKHFNIDLMETVANAEKTKTLKEFACGSCYEDGLRADEMAFMEQCGHHLCKECFGFYL